MTTTEFIKTYSQAIIDACKGTTLFPSVKMAQAALETGWGAKVMGEAHNMFGIKAAGPHSPYWKGDFVTSNTTEYENGAYVPHQLKFRKYASLADSIRDHTYFLQQNHIYDAVFLAKTPIDQAKALLAAGYATDYLYANKLITIINTNNLNKLDKKTKSMKNFDYLIWGLLLLVAVAGLYKAYKS